MGRHRLFLDILAAFYVQNYFIVCATRALVIVWALLVWQRLRQAGMCVSLGLFVITHNVRCDLHTLPLFLAQCCFANLDQHQGSG